MWRDALMRERHGAGVCIYFTMQTRIMRNGATGQLFVRLECENSSHHLNVRHTCFVNVDDYIDFLLFLFLQFMSV